GTRGRRCRSGICLHYVAFRQGRSAEAEHRRRLRVQDRGGNRKGTTRDKAIRRRTWHAGATLLQSAMHRLRRRSAIVRRHGEEGTFAEGTSRGLQGRIRAGRLCISATDRPTPRPCPCESGIGAARCKAAAVAQVRLGAKEMTYCTGRSQASPERTERNRAGITGPTSIFLRTASTPSVAASGQTYLQGAELLPYFFCFFFLVAMMTLLYASARRQNVLTGQHIMKNRR